MSTLYEGELLRIEECNDASLNYPIVNKDTGRSIGAISFEINADVISKYYAEIGIAMPIIYSHFKTILNKLVSSFDLEVEEK